MAGKSKGPKAVTANRLADGAVVYFTPDNTWSFDVRAADWAEAPEAQQALLERAQPFAARSVAAPYLFDVRVEDAGPTPAHPKEIVRAQGPTVRPDLGPQAANGPAPTER
jgi:sulfite reductase (NADPH) hemoprotein beta-component